MKLGRLVVVTFVCICAGAFLGIEAQNVWPGYDVAVAIAAGVSAMIWAALFVALAVLFICFPIGRTNGK